MKISLVILTLNEIVGLKQLFKSIPLSTIDETIAVDGGSTDGTIEFLSGHGIPVFTQSKRGRGEAFRLAFEKAQGDALIFFSPDGNEDPADIPKFAHFLNLGNALVIANRMSSGGVNEEDIHWLKPRKWVNNLFTVFANLCWRRKQPYINDTINGYRAITKSAWDKLKLDGPGYTIEYQSSIRALKLGLKVAEFPTVEGQRIDGRMGSPGLKTGIEFLKLLFREVWSR